MYEVIKACVKPEELVKIEKYHRKISEVVGKPVGFIRIMCRANKLHMDDQFESLYDV